MVFIITFAVCLIFFVASELFVVYHKIKIAYLDRYYLTRLLKDDNDLKAENRKQLKLISDSQQKIESKLIAIDYSFKDNRSIEIELLNQIKHEIEKSK